jgi:hypothetical protein
MTNQPDNKTLTPQALRQSLLSTLQASKQAITALTDEQLVSVVGGFRVPLTHEDKVYIFNRYLANDEVNPNGDQHSAPPSPRRERLPPSQTLRRTLSAGPIMSDTQFIAHVTDRIQMRRG